LVARNPNAPIDALNTLATDEDLTVRYWLTKNPNIPVKSLMSLARDKDKWIRKSVGEHPRATELVKRLVLMTNTHQKS
jgi:hypothetical protein